MHACFFVGKLTWLKGHFSRYNHPHIFCIYQQKGVPFEVKIIIILLASEPLLVVCFLKRNCFNCETLELHRRNEVSRRYALHCVRYALTTSPNIINKRFFVFFSQMSKTKTFLKREKHS